MGRESQVLQGVDRRALFLLVGGVNTVLGGVWFLVFDTLMGSLGDGAGHYAALVLTYACAVLTGFALYRNLVFRVRGQWWKDLSRYSTVYVGAFALNVVLFAVLLQVAGLHPWAAQLVNIIVISVMTYVLHGRFSFRRSQPDEHA